MKSGSHSVIWADQVTWRGLRLVPKVRNSKVSTRAVRAIGALEKWWRKEQGLFSLGVELWVGPGEELKLYIPPLGLSSTVTAGLRVSSISLLLLGPLVRAYIFTLSLANHLCDIYEISSWMCLFLLLIFSVELRIFPLTWPMYLQRVINFISSQYFKNPCLRSE